MMPSRTSKCGSESVDNVTQFCGLENPYPHTCPYSFYCRRRDVEEVTNLRYTEIRFSGAISGASWPLYDSEGRLPPRRLDGRLASPSDIGIYAVFMGAKRDAVWRKLQALATPGPLRRVAPPQVHCDTCCGALTGSALGQSSKVLP